MLRIDTIDVYYGQIQAIRHLSVEVQEGEFVALIGANGAGKTTTMKAVSGLLRPRQGSIEFAGQSIHHLEPHDITSMGLVQIPEGRRIFPTLTVRENLEMGSYSRRAKKERGKSMEKVFGLFPVLCERWRQLAGTLSGGEQQMLAIGRALMTLPRLLMIDEPSLGLSPLITENIFQTIHQINQEGATILLVEQNVFASLDMAHRGYVIENGEIVLQGQSKDLMRNEGVRKAYLGLQ